MQISPWNPTIICVAGILNHKSRFCEDTAHILGNERSDVIRVTTVLKLLKLIAEQKGDFASQT